MNALAPYILLALAVIAVAGNWVFQRYWGGERGSRSTSIGVAAFSYVLAAVFFFGAVTILTTPQEIYISPKANAK